MISVTEAQKLMFATFNEFKKILSLNRQNSSGPFHLLIHTLPEWEEILARPALPSELFEELDTESYNYLLGKCYELADLYHLSTRDRLAGAVVKYGVAEVEPVTPTSISVGNTSLPEAEIVVQQNVVATSRWIDNGNGTFTAKSRATLYGLFGREWPALSGWPVNRDPGSLHAGETVGRNDALIGDFDENLGVLIKANFGGETLANIRNYIVQNVAYPIRRDSINEIATFFAQHGIALADIDVSGNEFNATVINLPQERTRRFDAVRGWGRAGFEAARDSFTDVISRRWSSFTNNLFNRNSTPEDNIPDSRTPLADRVDNLTGQQQSAMEDHRFQQGGPGWYGYRGPYLTYCNLATIEIAEGTGFNTDVLFGPNSNSGTHRSNTLANTMTQNLVVAAAEGRVIEVTPANAQLLADKGVTVIAAWENPTGPHGHIATVSPRVLPVDRDNMFINDPLIAHVGSAPNGIRPASEVFPRGARYFFDSNQQF